MARAAKGTIWLGLSQTQIVLIRKIMNEKTLPDLADHLLTNRDSILNDSGCGATNSDF